MLDFSDPDKSFYITFEGKVLCKVGADGEISLVYFERRHVTEHEGLYYPKHIDYMFARWMPFWFWACEFCADKELAERMRVYRWADDEESPIKHHFL